MPVFTDSHGEQWLVSLDVNRLKRLKECGIDLAAMLNSGEMVEQMHTDPIMLVDMLYVLCERQAKDQGVTDEQFGGRVASAAAIESAADALLEAIAAFFGGRGKVALAAMRKIQQLEAEVTDRMAQRLESASPEELSSLASGGQFTNSPEPLESTPAP